MTNALLCLLFLVMPMPTGALHAGAPLTRSAAQSKPRSTPAPKPVYTSPVPPRGPFTFACTAKGARAGTLRVTYFSTTPELMVLERNGVTRVAFQTIAASGARYEGNGVLFWEAHGEVTLNWLGKTAVCTQR